MVSELARGDLGAFAARLHAFNRASVIRFVPDGDHSQLWSAAWDGVVVNRAIAAPVVADCVVKAADVLDVVQRQLALTALANLRTYDMDWRCSLPHPRWTIELDMVPAAVFTQIHSQAQQVSATSTVLTVMNDQQPADTPRVTGLGTDVSREADASPTACVPARAVQALVGMNFMADQPVTVLHAGNWQVLAARFGSVWWRSVDPGGHTLGIVK